MGSDHPTDRSSTTLTQVVLEGHSLTDGSGQDALGATARYVEAVLTGSLTTAVAILAVAFVGLGLLGGRIDVRRGLSVILGCFILFGAPVIARGLLSLAGGALGSHAQQHSKADQPLPIPQPQAVSSTPFDPYAGASVPPR